MTQGPIGKVPRKWRAKVRGRLDDRLMKGRGEFIVPIRPLIHRKECFHLDFYPGFLEEWDRWAS